MSQAIEAPTSPRVRLGDISLKHYDLSPRVRALKDVYFRAMPEICLERPRLVTRFSQDHGFFRQDKISVLDKAKMYRWVLERRLPVIRHVQAFEKGMRPFEFEDRNLFAGSTTTRFKGVPIYPEYIALMLWPELWTISERESNPFHLLNGEADELNKEIFPAWIDSNIIELVRKRCFEENARRFGREKYAPELKLMERLSFFLASKTYCISHTIPDFSRAIRQGLRVVIEEAQSKERDSIERAQKEFYLGVIEVLEGIVTYSNRLASRAEAMALEETDPEVRQELLDMARINRQVPEFPARNFREGLSTVWVCWTALHLENANAGLSLGRLDQLLWELYRQDIDSGAIEVEDAIELLCCLWLKIGDHVPMIPDAAEQLFGGTGSNQAITVGGVDDSGQDAVNDLTYVMLRATELMKLRDPNLNARYFSGVNSKDYLRRLCEVNLNTGATPAIHNDKAVIGMMTGKGETLEQARDYGVIGCVEPGSNGRSFGSTASIHLNLASALELALFNGKHRNTGLDLLISKETGSPSEFKTFEEFRAAFEEQTRYLITQATTLNDTFGRVHQDYNPTPILSALFEGPMETGRDVIHGGAVINYSGATIIGFADVADSLSAIQRLVFEEKSISFADFIVALEKNFEGHEALHTRLMNPEKTPKYGNEDPTADANINWIAGMLDQAFGEKTTYRGGRFRVGYWTMTNNAGFGRLMKALPSGRKANENFTSGITPVSGVTPSLTPALNSVAGLPAGSLSSGVALNLKYTPEGGDRERMLDNFAASIEGYFDDDDGQRDGGMEIQFNITTHDTFVDAVAHPEKYPELLVRVSGYTAYFKDLSPQMQKEIIDRTEYLLSSGRAAHFEPFQLSPS